MKECRYTGYQGMRKCRKQPIAVLERSLSQSRETLLAGYNCFSKTEAPMKKPKSPSLKAPTADITKEPIDVESESRFDHIEKKIKMLLTEHQWNLFVRVHRDGSNIWIRSIKPGCSYLSADILAHVSAEKCEQIEEHELLSKIERKIKNYVNEQKNSRSHTPDHC